MVINSWIFKHFSHKISIKYSAIDYLSTEKKKNPEALKKYRYFSSWVGGE